MVGAKEGDEKRTKIKTIKKTDGYDLDFVEKQAKMVIERDGKHYPLAILSSKDSIFICPMMLGDYKDKQVTQDVLRDFVHKMNIREYWIIIESWISSNVYVDRAKDDINRKEALTISWFSADKCISGKLISNIFERKNKKIVWKERIVLDSGFSTPWNFYLEDMSDAEYNDAIKKSRIADMTKRVEQADLSEEINRIKKAWKREKGTDIELTDKEIKDTIIKMVKEGKIKFIPEKFKLKDDDISKKLKEVKKE